MVAVCIQRVIITVAPHNSPPCFAAILQSCVTVNEDTGSVLLGKQRQFVFDHAFGPHVAQQQVYSGCISDLVDAVVEGYNATVLAYGPTGSGKTYTMGTGSALHCMPEQQGIIPRVIRSAPAVLKGSCQRASPGFCCPALAA